MSRERRVVEHVRHERQHPVAHPVQEQHVAALAGEARAVDDRRLAPGAPARAACGQSSGSYSRSASWMSTRSPVTCSSAGADRRALARGSRVLDDLDGAVAELARAPAGCRRSLPSSTTMNSRSIGSSTARMRRMISTTVLRSLKTGTITESLRYPPVSTRPRGASGRVDARTPRGTTRSVRSRPSRSWTSGSHPSTSRASVMSGWRCVGSSIGQRLERDLRRRAGDVEHRLGQLEDRELVRVADVHRADVVGLEQRRGARRSRRRRSRTTASACRRRRP